MTVPFPAKEAASRLGIRSVSYGPLHPIGLLGDDLSLSDWWDGTQVFRWLLPYYIFTEHTFLVLIYCVARLPKEVVD